MAESKEIRTRISSGHITCNREFEEVLKENKLLDFDRVMSIFETRTVKHVVPQRRTGTFTFKKNGETVSAFIKRHTPVSVGKYLKERIRLASNKTAFDEFTNIIAFQKAGLPTMVPVAAGERSRGVLRSESFLITEEIKGCITLEKFIESSLKDKTFPEKRELVKKTALLTKKMHDSGFNHRDFYLCHLLIGIEEHNKNALYVVDLHRVDIRKKVPERWRIKDLAALNFSAESENISQTDKLRFLMHYLSAEKLSAAHRLFALKIIKKTGKMLQRDQCCIRRNRFFTEIKSGDLKGYAALPLNNDILQLMKDPDTLFSNPDVSVLKDSDSASCLLFPGRSGFYLKKYHAGSMFEVLKNTLRSSKAKRSWIAANVLKNRSIPTPEPILFLERKKFGLIRESYFVTEALSQAKPLNLYMDAGFKLLSGQNRRSVIEALALKVKHLHDCGVRHRDLKSTNILVKDDDDLMFWFTDLDAVKISGLLSLAGRAKDIARLNCSFLEKSVLSMSDRLYFLSAYLGQAKRKELKKTWETVVFFTGLKLKKSKRAIQ